MSHVMLKQALQFVILKYASTNSANGPPNCHDKSNRNRFLGKLSSSLGTFMLVCEHPEKEGLVGFFRTLLIGYPGSACLL